MSHRLYTDLAAWWAVLSPPEDYVEDAALAAGLLRTAEREVCDVLELGSGGGHNAVHLKKSFAMTLVDLAPAMLAASAALNPECEHHEGDMRTVRLGRDFDAVLVHDAVDYLRTPEELAALLATARAHCRPGGVAVLMPDHVRETFEPRTEHGGGEAPDGRSARYLEWSWDPDTSDTQVRTSYTFVLREADGSVRSVTETHEFGLFARRQWLDLLQQAGFDATALQEAANEDHTPRTLFVGHLPKEAAAAGRSVPSSPDG